MTDTHNKESRFTKWKNKFLVIVYDGNSLEEISNFRISRINIASYISAIVLITSVLIFLLFKFTPFRALIGYQSDPEMKKAVVLNSQRVDSLVEQIKIRDMYYENLKQIMRGEVPQGEEIELSDTSFEYTDIDFSKSKHDSILRKQIEEEEQISLSMIEETSKKANSLESLHFFAPIKGIITNGFDATAGHFGTDIVAEANKPILATLSGTVIYAGWTMDTGHVIQIQHENNLVSFYKHNSSLLKKTGDHVKAGESIAIIGNSGELTTGPHLHFEIWHNGVPLNPENYLVFQ